MIDHEIRHLEGWLESEADLYYRNPAGVFLKIAEIVRGPGDPPQARGERDRQLTDAAAVPTDEADGRISLAGTSLDDFFVLVPAGRLDPP